MSRRRRRRNIPQKIIISAVIGVIAVSVLLTEKTLGPAAELQAGHFAERTADCIIGKAVSDYIEQNGSECSTGLRFDEYGDTAVIGEDVNRVQTELALLINERLGEMGRYTAKVPLGTVTGLYLLAGRGPSIRFRVCPVGEAEVHLRSEFVSAGVNQTCHRVCAEITADITSGSPLYSFDIEKKFDYVLSETIIKGEVPFGSIGQE